MKHAMRSTFCLSGMALATACTSMTSETHSASTAYERSRLDAAVARACLDVPDDLRAACPVERGHVVAVKAVREPATPKGRDFLVGARLYVPASPGMTEQWLGHRIACYQARLAAMPPVSPAACPIADPSATVRVDGTNDGFAVTVKSDDLEIARAILRTSESFAD